MRRERSAIGSPAPLQGIEALLKELAQLLLSETRPERVLPSIADRLGDLIPHDRLAIYRTDPSGRLLLPELVRDPEADRILATGPVPFGRGIAGGVAEAGRPELIEDVGLDPRRQHLVAPPSQPESMIAVPLMARAELKGVMCLSRIGDGPGFSVQEFHVAVQFGTLAALFIDNTEVRARLERDVVIDHLTGLYNHRYFHERLAEEVARAHRRHSSVGLLLFDIDDFSAINDREGHRFGDQVLRDIADISVRTCREEDPVCRIGGEEFAVILPGQSVPDTWTLGERLRRAIAGPNGVSPFRATVSLGVASAPAHAVSSRDLFHRANEALLRAKADGKNRVCVYKEERGAWGHDGSAAATIGTQPEGSAQEQGVPGRDVRSVAQIEILHDLSDKLIRVRDPRAIGRVVREELRDVVGYHRCLIYLVDATGRALVPLLTDVDSDAETGPSEDSAIPLGTGVVGRAVATGRTINVRASSRCELSPFPESSGGTESSLAVPLRYGDRVTGAIALCKRGAAQFDRDDERMVEIVSSTAAIALENARLLLGAEGRNHSAPEWPRRTS